MIEKRQRDVVAHSMPILVWMKRRATAAPSLGPAPTMTIDMLSPLRRTARR
jgi:hypothetical protein